MTDKNDRIRRLAAAVNKTSREVREAWADLGVALVRAEGRGAPL